MGHIFFKRYFSFDKIKVYCLRLEDRSILATGHFWIIINQIIKVIQILTLTLKLQLVIMSFVDSELKRIKSYIELNFFDTDKETYLLFDSTHSTRDKWHGFRLEAASRRSWRLIKMTSE